MTHSHVHFALQYFRLPLNLYHVISLIIHDIHLHLINDIHVAAIGMRSSITNCMI